MKSLAASLLLSACLLAPATAAPLYLPSGPQGGVNLSTVLDGGWTLCYSGLMKTAIGDEAEFVKQSCQGEYLMMAGREKDASRLLALAATSYSDAFLRTGRDSDTHVSNGAQWWYEPDWSWGFAGLQDLVVNFECNTRASALGMCLHTMGDVGGYRINNLVGLNDSADYEKLFFVSGLRTPDQGSQVPLPASLTLAGLGLALLAGSRRRA